MTEHYTVIQDFILSLQWLKYTSRRAFFIALIHSYCTTNSLWQEIILCSLRRTSAEDDIHLADFLSKDSTFLSGRVHHPQTSYCSYLESNHKLLSLERPIIPRQGVLEL